MAVERAANEIRGITEADRLLPVMRQILLLAAIRDDTAAPEAASVEELPELAAEEIVHAVLGREELLRDSESELALAAGETFLRGLWNGDDEADDLLDGERTARGLSPKRDSRVRRHSAKAPPWRAELLALTQVVLLGGSTGPFQHRM
ncbi:hypothetical protein GCM10010313_20180 [Streptomyces violarus]|nr:hypothetical protein GCM10010313_20180 [Streptomyces violarus]